MLLSEGALVISDAASPCRNIKSLSGGPGALLTFGPRSSGLRKVLTVILQTVDCSRRNWRLLTFLVSGDVCVAFIRYGDMDTSYTTRQIKSDSASAPQKWWTVYALVNTVSNLTSYEQLSPAPRQLSFICQAWICPTSLSETSGHEIPNSLQCRTRLQISYRHMQKIRNCLTKILYSGAIWPCFLHAHCISCKFALRQKKTITE